MNALCPVQQHTCRECDCALVVAVAVHQNVVRGSERGREGVTVVEQVHNQGGGPGHQCLVEERAPKRIEGDVSWQEGNIEVWNSVHQTGLERVEILGSCNWPF